MKPAAESPRTASPRAHAATRRRATAVGTLVAATVAANSGYAQDTPRWTLAEEMRIGSVDDDETSLTLVIGLDVHGDRIYVGQPLEARIRVFDLAGRAVGAIGRSGEGPGEFQRLGSFGWLGDTLWVVDGAADRISYFQAPGHLIGTQPASTPFFGAGFTPSPPMALAADGFAVTVPSYRGTALAEDPDLLRPILRTTRSGQIVDTIALVSEARSSMVFRRERSTSYSVQPFADHPLHAVARDASLVVVVDRRTPEPGEPPEYGVRRYPTDDPPPQPVRVPYTPIAIPSAVRDSVRMDRGRRLARGTGLREALDALDDELHLPATYPPATRVALGRDRKIWVRREAVVGARLVRWDILSPNAIPIAHVEAPPGLRVLDSQGDIVWASVTDDLDVPYVVRYRLVRSDG